MLNTGIPGEAEVALPSPQISHGEHVGGRFLVHTEVTFPLANRPTNRARLKKNGFFLLLGLLFFSPVTLREGVLFPSSHAHWDLCWSSRPSSVCLRDRYSECIEM